MNQISLLLADDHSVVREGLKQLLELDPGLNVVGEARNGQECIHQIRTLAPDLVLLDLLDFERSSFLVSGSVLLAASLFSSADSVTLKCPAITDEISVFIFSAFAETEKTGTISLIFSVSTIETELIYLSYADVSILFLSL